MQRRGEMIGTIDEYPTKADAQKASEHLRLTANTDNPGELNIVSCQGCIVHRGNVVEVA